ncbi:tyrosine-type recombinase/integrase, partial [Hominimerdicola sp. 21CYCFAH17_S]|jgi:phage integrase family site specific recombinase
MFGLIGKKNMTIKYLGEQWLADKRMTVKPSTYNNYKRLLIDHIFADIGDKKYTALDKQYINDYILSLMDSGRKDGKGGLSVSMTRDIIKALRAIAKFAQLEYGLKNICDGITMPRIKKPEAKTLSDGERRKLEKYLLSNQNLTNICIMLCLYTGLRIGELCGLQWKDIDFRRGCLTVCKTVQRISLGNGKTVISIDTPKTDSSVRVVYIPLFIIEMLKKFRQKPDIFVLSNRIKPTEPRTLQHKFKRILNNCKIGDISFHALRHTYATMCVEKQFDIKTLSELLGHSDVKITLNTYVHSSEKLKRKYVKRLAC